ncbi:MAG TPA: GTP cyclohydrolase I [Tepidisphaeraceae bacterium]|jgi:GTP cyclohydrolase I
MLIVVPASENPLEASTEVAAQLPVDKHEEVILVRDIWFCSIARHHLRPFLGKVHIAYLPAIEQIIPFSKLAQLVEGFARPPQVQERMTDQIADALVDGLAPKGVLVAVEAEHFRMKMSGVNKNSSVTVTSTARGLFRDNRLVGDEVLNLMLQSRSLR